MKRSRYVAGMALIAIGFAMIVSFGFGGESSGYAAAVDEAGWMNHRMIAHAMGSIDGKAYTNSYEAFMTNYNRGYRLFEVDLTMTSDGEIAARHDWTHAMQPGLPAGAGETPTLSQFKQARIYGKYQPLSWKDIITLMAKYPDVYVVVDAKETDLPLLSQLFATMIADAAVVDPAILQRVVPEIFTPEMYTVVMAEIPFPHFLYSLYRTHASADSIVAFVKDRQITAVAMPVSRTVVSPTLLHRLNKLGVKSYVHTVNNPVMMRWLQKAGAYGFYTEESRGPDALLAMLDNGQRGEAMLLLGMGFVCGRLLRKRKQAAA
ncbi:phosphatidylinositol-specific phospholipase C/glycerophosphodiester phosphodiesterase family protein [Paenibacillus cymbidii]|uniref:phosphatidylinositol-specific phospholipase C/glycerophosphodiester phosphodiesterase family protein n=1 Tax=Paenibacillus cymbidii TaxID=1639034 RepID=UPI00107FDB53|nr:phosphatidylinositol-specific phospholipase C/glycerophosphodiester phosphodiesterase family protein [Paenibacillus cymbidii]